MKHAVIQLFQYLRQNLRLTLVVAVLMLVVSVLNGIGIMVILPVVEYMIGGEISAGSLPVPEDLLSGIHPYRFLYGLLFLFAAKGTSTLTLASLQVRLGVRLRAGWTRTVYSASSGTISKT